MIDLLFAEGNPGGVKNVLKGLGICDDTMRLRLVNISEGTYAMVKDVPDLDFVPRGEVEAKGKGLMKMYFVQAHPAA